MLMASIQNGPDNDDRLAALSPRKIIEPWTRERFLDHGLGHHSGIRVIPASAEIGHDTGIDSRDLRFMTAAGRSYDCPHQSKRDAKTLTHVQQPMDHGTSLHKE